MKRRLLALSLIGVLLFSCGCNYIFRPIGPTEIDEAIETNDDAFFDPTPHVCPPLMESDLWIYGEYAYINCLHSGKNLILRASLAGGQKEVAVENAKIFDFCGSVMIYQDVENEKYHLNDLQGRETILPANTLSFHTLFGETLYLFGHQEAQMYCYKIDLSSLVFTAHPISKNVLYMRADETDFYYTYSKNNETALMRYDRATGQEKEIYRSDKGIGFDFNERWFIYWSGIYNNPYIYERDTGAVRRAYDDPYGVTLGLHGDYVLRNVDQRNGIHNYAVFDLSKGAEVPLGDLGFANSIWHFDLFKDGFVYYDTYPLQTASVYINGEKRTVTVNKKFTKDAVLNVKANEQGIAFITERELYTATWKNPVVKKYDHGK